MTLILNNDPQAVYSNIADSHMFVLGQESIGIYISYQVRTYQIYFQLYMNLRAIALTARVVPRHQYLKHFSNTMKHWTGSCCNGLSAISIDPLPRLFGRRSPCWLWLRPGVARAPLPGFRLVGSGSRRRTSAPSPGVSASAFSGQFFAARATTEWCVETRMLGGFWIQGT